MIRLLIPPVKFSLVLKFDHVFSYYKVDWILLRCSVQNMKINHYANFQHNTIDGIKKITDTNIVHNSNMKKKN